MLRILIAFISLSFLSFTAFADDPSDRQRNRIAKLAEASGARLGVAAYDLGTGDEFAYADDERFATHTPLTVPLGVTVLQAVEAGMLRLDQEVAIERNHLAMQWSPIAATFQGPTMTFTIEQLLARAIGESDNTAADVLMRAVGGPLSVTSMLAKAGIGDMRVDRYEREAQPQRAGLPPFDHDEIIDQARYEDELQAIPPSTRNAALTAWLEDPRDSATPAAAVLFLRRLDSGALLTPRMRDHLLDIMPDRPHDMAITTLPDGRRIAVAIFLAGPRVDAQIRDVTHAAVMREVLAYFDGASA